MAEKDNHHVRRHSSRKLRTQTTSSLLQLRKSVSSPSSPVNKGNRIGNPSRSRQLWSRAVENVLEQEKLTPPVTSTTSSTIVNEPIGWYNLTKR